MVSGKSGDDGDGGDVFRKLSSACNSCNYLGKNFFYILYVYFFTHKQFCMKVDEYNENLVKAVKTY